jgi:DNA (cytosine-5)-methyltransferase 1
MRAKRKPHGTDRPTALDLFSGCGGLTVGLKRAGFSVLAAVERWDVAAEAYELNHKDVQLLKSDIRDCDPVELMRSLNLCAGDLDLLAGCPPCQGFSALRTLNGHVPVTEPSERLDLRVRPLRHRASSQNDPARERPSA